MSQQKVIIVIAIIILIGVGGYYLYKNKDVLMGENMTNAQASVQSFRSINPANPKNMRFSERDVMRIAQDRLRDQDDERAIIGHRFRRLQVPVVPRLGGEKAVHRIGADRASEVLGIDVPTERMQEVPIITAGHQRNLIINRARSAAKV